MSGLSKQQQIVFHVVVALAALFALTSLVGAAAVILYQLLVLS